MAFPDNSRRGQWESACDVILVFACSRSQHLTAQFYAVLYSRVGGDKM